ncbi:ATPase [uncultured Sphingomonas sp.]|uniref:F0F1 ATP synthase subunit B family protein n=1 Tax=uncultured Sphingomonas sp. TaxID=158754 RepID=UPI0025DDFBB9|nr:ATPase [uncultured Sphingomonas sp.]
MPQIAQIGEIYASQLFWLAIVFGAIFLIVGLGMVPKIQGTVDKRDARIAADLQEAATARETADRLEEQYREQMDRSRAESAKLAAEAKAEAARATEARVSEADRFAAGKLELASRRIAEARSSAKAEIETVASEAAAAMVQRVAGMTVEPAVAQVAVQQELARGR